MKKYIKNNIKDSLVGKVGYMKNKDIPGVNLTSGGHYVYIVESGKVTRIKTITSIENYKKDIKHEIPYNTSKYSNIRYLSNKKLRDIRQGKVIPIPISDSNFYIWSGINVNSVVVNKDKIEDIDVKKIKNRRSLW
ncbi:MAG: hypothetical protein RSD40_03565 [Bacilli bacterium]